MKKKDTWQAAGKVISFCLLIVAVVALIFQFMNKNNARITEQNQRYLEDAAEQSVKNVNELFRNSSKSIAMVSYLYEQQMDGQEVDYRELDSMTEKTQFEYLRFVDKDGISYTGAGEYADCSERDYYLEGIQGKSGISFVQDSKFLHEKMIIFYTPLYYDGKIVGVMNGVLTEDYMKDFMKSSFFGVESREYLCLSDGTVAAAYGEGTYQSNILDGIEQSNSVSEEVFGKIKDAFSEGQSYSYKYSGEDGTGNGYVTTLEDSDWVLVKTFPSTAGKGMIQNANKDAIYLEIALIIIFGIYIIFIILLYIRKNRKLQRENQNIEQIVDSVKQLYSRFVVFDLENDTYEYLAEGEMPAFGIARKGVYSKWLEKFQVNYADDEKSQKMKEYMSAESMRKNLNLKNRFIQYEYGIRKDQIKWEKISLIKLNMDTNETKRVLGAVEDVTKLKEDDMAKCYALEEAFHSAEAANSAKSDFLSRMSHDIRTPMNAIIGLTAIVGTHLDDKERVVDCLSKITASSKHLLSLINEVLDMSKIESGKFSLSETEFSLSELIDNLLDMMRTSVKEKNLSLSVHTHDIKHEEVIGDSLRIQQVFTNIMSNAVKYTEEGGSITVTITEKQSRQPRIGRYEFVFEDTGIGMSPEFLDRIFAPFERAEDTRVNKIQGTGLGMPIAQNIVRMMDGDITVESELGKGSRFTVNISLKLQNVDPEVEKRLMGLPVLVADDDADTCESACIMLNELGMKGSFVLTGQEAVDSVVAAHEQQEDFFAVILDWKMPEMDGLETAKAIRREVGPDIPIVILSAYDWSEIENEARAAGVDAFISKPLFKSRLRSVFTNIVLGESPADEANQLKIMQEKDFSGKRVLLVEDNEMNREIAEEILKMTGLEVDMAENGKEGLDMFSNSPKGYYAMIFMDIQMPIMNGYEATSAIRSLTREDAKSVPIVAMTANAFAEDVQAAKNAGMNEHIAKPLEIERLVKSLERWL